MFIVQFHFLFSNLETKVGGGLVYSIDRIAPKYVQIKVMTSLFRHAEICCFRGLKMKYVSYMGEQSDIRTYYRYCR